MVPYFSAINQNLSSERRGRRMQATSISYSIIVELTNCKKEVLIPFNKRDNNKRRENKI